jgi:predicted XRE-type DNA-binding protein
VPTAKKGKRNAPRAKQRGASSKKPTQTAATDSAAPASQPARALSARDGRKSDRPLIPKAELAREIATIIRYHHLTQTQAAQIVGDAPSQISLLLGGHIEGFSTERLLRMLLRLGRDIELVFRPAQHPRAARFRITHKSELTSAQRATP